MKSTKRAVVILVALVGISCTSASTTTRPAFETEGVRLPIGDAPPQVVGRNASDRRPEEDPTFRNANAPVITFRISGEDVYPAQVSLYQQRDGKTYAQIRLEATDGGRWTESIVSSTDLPELKTLFQAFTEIQINPVTDDRLYMPGMMFQVWVTGVVSESYFSLRLPSEASDAASYWGRPSTGADALVAWVRQLAKAVSLEYVRHR